MSDTLTRLTAALAATYRLERELGQGGMATVYLAEDLKHHRPVAIKVLRPELASVIGPARFLREIEVAAGLQHPHILTVYDSGEADGLLYYVMPFVEGESLAARLHRDGPMAVPDAIRILREVADALSYAHARGLVHRDIKPDNIMLSGSHALVADFGIARVAQEAAGAERLTATGMALGTPAYMAPEQASGEAVDHRADLYALGVVAYQTLAGELPFRGHNAQQLIAAHLTAAPTPVTQFRPGLPPALSTLVMRCLEKHPADRVQTAAEFMTQVEGALTPVTGTTPFSGTTPAGSILPRGMSTGRVAVLFGLAAIGVLGIVYGLMTVLGLPSWVVPAAAGLLVIGLPIILTTSQQARSGTAAPGGLFTWRKALTGGGLAFAGLGVAVTAYMLMRAFGIGPVGTLVASGILDEHPQVVLADFTDRGGDSTLAAAVTEAFRVDLGQSASLDLVQAAALDEAFARMQQDRPRILTTEVAREVAAREGIKAVVTGEINSVGGSFVISAQLLTAESGEVLVPARETARDSTEILAAVDRLSHYLRERIGESLRTIRATPALAQVTTASVPALRAYTRASRALDAGEPTVAIQFFREATAIDSTFAAAYRGLGIVLGNFGIDRAQAAEANAAAYRYRSRLTEKERLWTEGSYFMSSARYDQALTAYLALRELEPENPRLLNNLGVVYLRQRQDDKALDYYRQALERAPNQPNAVFNFVTTSANLGNLAEARQAAVTFRSEVPDSPMNDANTWVLGWTEHQYDSVEAAINRLAARGDPAMASIISQGRVKVAMVRGQSSKVDGALAVGQERARAGRQVAEYLRDVAAAAVYDAEVRGKPEAGVARMDQALSAFPLADLDPFDRPYAEIAEFFARAGKVTRARALLTEYQREVPDILKPQLLQPIGIAQGYTLLGEGRPAEAAREFQRADIDMCAVCVLPGLARAWEAQGDRDSVLAILQRMVDRHDDDRALVDPLELPGVYSRLGELYEGAGDRERAIEYNGKFLDLWKAAEPEFSSVIEQVRQRQQRLLAERGGR